MREIGVGIVGVGTVGTSVVSLLQKNADIIFARTGTHFVVKRGVVKDLSKNRQTSIPLSKNIFDVIYDPDIEIVIELMGGVDQAYEVAHEVLKAKKYLVTANKAMLAYHRYELEAMAGDSLIGFEASVCGGIPVIKAIRDGMGANHILSLKGILNGTSNFILTEMIQKSKSFEEALDDAKKMGYAEADPTLDISGVDAGHKLLILASLAYGINVTPEQILIEGISKIQSVDISFAKEFGFVIKSLGIAKKHGDSIELRVHPTLIPKEEMLSKVDGVMNAVSIVGDYAGEMLYYGAGAGGNATASAVVSDLIEIARRKHSSMLGFDGGQIGHKLLSQSEIVCRYYIRTRVYDRAGVLSTISSIFAKYSISIQVVLQREAKFGVAELLFITHSCTESKIKISLACIDAQDFISESSFFIRIED